MADHQDANFLVADVIIDHKVPRLLSYLVPKEMAHGIKEGMRCEVPIQNRVTKGFVFALKPQSDVSKLKTLLALSDSLVLPVKLLELALWMSRYYITPLSRVLHFFVPKVIKDKSLEVIYTHALCIEEKKPSILDFLKKEHPRKKKAFGFIDSLDGDPKTLKVFKSHLGQELFDLFVENKWIQLSQKASTLDFEAVACVKKTLTPEQDSVSKNLIHALCHTPQSVHLLYGVCGSGKTEVYMEVIEEALKKGQGVIYLVPEVALAPQTIRRLKQRFQVPMALLHHQISDGIKKQEFEALLEGRIQLVVGARSAIFAPVKNLGLIIIDEEHETAYKQEGMPTYHAKDVAIMRARLEKAMVIMGSATPSIETFYHAKEGKITLHQLLNRPRQDAMPEIHVAALGTEFQKAQGFHLFAEPTLKALKQTFERGEQSLIFINRRGYNALQTCSSCAEAIKCTACSIAMTFHKSDNLLICHFCGFKQPPPARCPLCSHETMQFKGIGTQLVESRIGMILKEARILRIDKDTTSKKGSLESYFESFSSHGADVLIGTKMIAKGLDFSHLTLAIILNIDGAFNKPDFKAHEEAFQLMTQVAGRAGRSILKGQVFIQTQNPDHDLIKKAQSAKYTDFYTSEIKERELYLYPPFSRLVRFVFSSKELDKLESYASCFRERLIGHLSTDYIVEPLIPCFHEKIDHHYRLQFLIKGKKALKLFEIIDTIDSKLKMSSSLKRLIDVDPQSTYF
jgi:primosomal protein N' (replication factor Y)